MKQLRVLVSKYLRKTQDKERLWIKEKKYGVDLTEVTINEIYRKVFVNHMHGDTSSRL